jgi:flagellar biogenesis protein FliO
MGAVLDAALDAALHSGQSAILSVLQALAAMLLLAALFWIGRRGLMMRNTRGQSATMQVEERIALDLKNALIIVRVGDRRLLLATAEVGTARLLCELAAPTGPAPLPSAPREP